MTHPRQTHFLTYKPASPMTLKKTKSPRKNRGLILTNNVAGHMNYVPRHLLVTPAGFEPALPP